MRAPLFIAVFCALFLLSQVNGYTVSGNKILDPNGNQVLLRGVDRPSLEWSVVGEELSLGDYTNMKNWGANVVRVALNQDSWLAGGTAGPAYQAVVQQQATWITQNLGMGCIFDLHWNQGGQQVMADHNSITFWKQMAQTFKSNPWVIFELYNEPHDIPVSTWLNGDGNWAGMQQLYNAVRGDGGANNMVIVNGLDWAYDLSMVGSSPVSGTNIAYGTHPYDNGSEKLGTANWQSHFAYLLPNYPVIMTEFGQYCDTNTFVSDLLTYATQNGIHWSAWAWYVSGCGFPSIITDWNGTPISGVGELVKSYLGGGTPAPTSGSGSGSTSSASTTSAAGTPPPLSGSSLVIYTDSLLNGFESYSWGNTPNFASTNQVFAGTYSIDLPEGQYGAVYFHTDNYFYLDAYSAFDFEIYPDSANAISQLFVIIYDTSATLTAIGSPLSFSATPGKWNHITIPVSSFNTAATQQVSGVAIQANVSPNSGNLYIDNVQFLGASSSATTAAATTTHATTAATTTTHATTAATTAAATTTTHATTAATSSSTSTHATTAAATTTTHATTAAATTASATATTGSTCGASSIVFTQTPGSGWSNVSPFSVTISSTCTTKTLVALSFSLSSNWNPLVGGYWGVTVSGSTATLPSYVQITASSPFTGFGYQNQGGEVSFAVTSFTFQ